MKNIFSFVFVVLAFTSWLWPIIFVSSLLDAIKKILSGDRCENEKIRAVISLFMMTITPIITALLVTSN